MTGLSNRTPGIIHAPHITIAAVKPYVEKYIPDVSVMHPCGDTIRRDNTAGGPGAIPKRNYGKFARHAYNLQEAGADANLPACLTFNSAAETPNRITRCCSRRLQNYPGVRTVL